MDVSQHAGSDRRSQSRVLGRTSGNRLAPRRVNPLALDLLAKGEVNLKDLITHDFPFEQTEEAIKTAIDPAIDTLKVVISMP